MALGQAAAAAMSTRVRSAAQAGLDDLRAAMAEAFSDYLTPLNLSPKIFRFMLAQRGFDSTLSQVAVVEGRIASFSLIGTDGDPRVPGAYVISMGTLPAFRRRGLAQQVFGAVKRATAEAGKTALSLEVIDANDAARGLYEALGFIPRRKLLCFDLSGPLPRKEDDAEITVRPIVVSEHRDLLAPFHDKPPSWQNDFGALARVEDQVNAVGAYLGGVCVGYGAVFRPIRALAQIAVNPAQRRRGIGRSILQRLLSEADANRGLTVLNIDEGNRSLKGFLERLGARQNTVQSEMVLRLA